MAKMDINYINKFADSEDEMFKDDDESKFQCEDVPVDRCQVSLFVSETLVVTVRLEWKDVKQRKVCRETLTLPSSVQCSAGARDRVKLTNPSISPSP